jgi:hypothetical protein
MTDELLMTCGAGVNRPSDLEQRRHHSMYAGENDSVIQSRTDCNEQFLSASLLAREANQQRVARRYAATEEPASRRTWF